MTILRSVRTVAMLALLVPGAAVAQGKAPAPGIRLGVGVGASGFSATCDACNSDMPIGLDREVTVGLTLSSRLEAGIAVTGWTGRTEGFPEKESSILATLRGYPFTGRPLHFDLGAGMGRYRAALEPDAGPEQTAAADGFAWSVGVGYDLGVGNELMLVPQVTWRQISDSPLTMNDVEITTTGFRVVTVGAALRWRAVPFLPKSGAR